MSVDTAIETLDAGEEEGEGNGGRTDQYNDDEDRGEEVQGNHNNTCGQMIPKSVVAGVTNSRYRSHTNSSGRLPQPSLSS